jgi:hypothetical protein
VSGTCSGKRDTCEKGGDVCAAGDVAADKEEGAKRQRTSSSTPKHERCDKQEAEAAVVRTRHK